MTRLLRYRFFIVKMSIIHIGVTLIALGGALLYLPGPITISISERLGVSTQVEASIFLVCGIAIVINMLWHWRTRFLWQCGIVSMVFLIPYLFYCVQVVLVSLELRTFSPVGVALYWSLGLSLYLLAINASLWTEPNGN